MSIFLLLEAIYQGSKRLGDVCSFTGRIPEEGDRMYLNALDNQVIPDLEMISLNYLPGNVPLDVKFTLESNSS